MSAVNYHQLCCRNIGRAAEIRTHGGAIHRGFISRVHNGRVYLRPFGPRRNFGGFGYGFWAPGFGVGFGVGIAVGAIATLAFLPFFWW